jgi:thioester reductase-like protein
MNASLMEQTECTLLLHASEVEAQVQPLLDHRPNLRLHPIQVLESLVQPDTQHYPYEKTYEEAKWDPILILHSSGSTGAPRPIEMNHATFAVGDNDRNLPTVEGRVNQNWSLWDFPNKEHFFSPFPAFHLAGFSSMVMLPIYYSNATLVMSPPTRPPTGNVVSEIMDHFPLKSIFCPPIIAEQLVQEPGGLEKCRSLNFLLYAGGPLSQAAGDALSKVTDVCQFYGQTETGAIQAFVPKREDWASLEWHPMQEARMEPSIDGSFEMVMHRNPKLEGVRSISCNFPDVEVWRTKDLFKSHPSKPGLWRFHGRADDIIVLSNGEKFNPVPSETQIAAHPLVAGALIIGNSYPQAALILEPKEYLQDPIALIEQVWPVIEQANEEAPGHARITRSMILVGSEDRPFERSPKGTVVRSSSGKKYDEDIAKLYTQDLSKDVQKIKLGTTHDLDSIRHFVRDIVGAALPSRSLSDEDDLFVLGLDSLQTTEIISCLKAGITADGTGSDVAWITARVVYQHPSINALSTMLHEQLAGPKDSATTNSSASKDRKQKLERLTHKYIDTAIKAAKRYDQKQSNLHVLLTGSTGSLGTQILAKLASDPKVSKISCLDRSPEAQERVTKSLSSWPQSASLDLSRVTFHQADFGQGGFGLDEDIFAELLDTVDVIIHNAWMVNFNHSVSSYEAVHIQGVHNFIGFSATSTLNARLVFISSISSVGNWHVEIPASGSGRKVVPETIPPTPAVAQTIGYAESKSVSEQILAAAIKNIGIRASIVRIGQIAGPIDEGNGGKWNEHEWFPLLLRTSKAVGKVPDASMLDNVDWVPVDVVAATTVDIAFSQNEQALQVYHLVNPSTATWADLLPSVQKLLGAVQAVSLQEWVGELEKADSDDATKPAVKILDFFKGMLEDKYMGSKDIEFSTKEVEKTSPALSQLGPVQVAWIERWMKDWGL